jgi:hypothetical protein
LKKALSTSAALALLLTAPTAAQAAGQSGLLGSGSAWEEVGPVGDVGDWHIQFKIHTDTSKGHIRVEVDGRINAPTAVFEADTSVCTGSFGTTVYAVGKSVSSTPANAYSPWVGYWAKDGGVGGTDYSWVVPIYTAAQAQSLCAAPQTVPTPFAITGGNIVIKG